MHVDPQAPLDGATSDAAAAGIAPRRPSTLVRAIGRLFWLAVAVWFVFALVVVAAREVVLPRLNDYRAEIGERISAAIGSRVTIGHIDARWSGIRPYLDLGEVALHDASGNVALELGLVRTSLSWMSIPLGELRLHHLEVDGPDLQIRRDPEGRLFVAGVEMAGKGGGGGFADWLLAQHEIVVRNAVIRWLDERRGAPELALKSVDLRLVNGGARHRLGIKAMPPQDSASPIDLRADFRGRDFARLGEWSGQLYVDVERVDLSAWRQWIDYPMDLPQGRGGLRLWADLEGTRLAGFTGDLTLDDVRLRLRDDLPMIDLVALRGRIAAKLPAGGLELTASGLSLATRDDTQIKPLDLQLSWHAAAGATPARGSLVASEVDLAALAQLAGNLPFDAETRRALDEFAPRGKVFGFKAQWSGDREKLTSWHGSARFADAALSARGLVPGFAAVSGTIDASSEGGTATISGRGASLDLPRVMPERRIALDELDAEVRWTMDRGRVDVHFPKLVLANADIAGTVSGHFTSHGDGRQSPGDIDLTGAFSRGAATEVWRYLPFVVSEHTRTWLKDALRGGRAENVRLRMKGDLYEFPWVGDKTGEFRVAADILNGRLAYAPGWPEIEGIGGSLLFRAERMTITGRRASILGAAVSDTTAEIADLMHPVDALLAIRGKAHGPTREFLAFIAASPVGEQIGHATRDMSADGDGSLDLSIDMPLNHLADTRVSGSFALSGNQLRVAPGVPPMADASARIEFTERTFAIRNGSGRLFGAPVQVSGQSETDGRVTVRLNGSASVSDVRGFADSPLFDHLSGSAPWSAVVSVRGQSAGLVVESDLQGVTSSLPDPLNKPANATLPLRLELGKPSAAPPGGDGLRVTVGNLADVKLIRRREGGSMAVERGGIGLRQEAPLPERGLAVAGNLDALDLDAWRRLVGGDPAAADGAGPAGALPLMTVNLRSGTVTAFGQHLNDVKLAATQADGAWQTRIESREITGDLSWRAGGRGRLRARLTDLFLSEVRSTPESSAAARESVDQSVQELPGLDVVAENFRLRGKSLGRLELVAVNRGNTWQIDRYSIANPDGGVSGSGQWRMAEGPRQPSETQIAFKLQSGNVGKLLGRFGYEDAVRRASANLEGNLAWQGAPASIDYPTLSGEMKLEASAGQFNRLEPGVGRLLGVLSLQSLPRRITLDFRDVFSDGFAFDSISGTMKVARGVIRTEDLAIRGPAARINMSGTTDVGAETQDMRVTVQPTLSESVALGAAIANPVAGVATLLAQKVLKDPIEKWFSYEYGVTGTWQDPQVVKLGGARPAPAQAPAPGEIVR